MKVTPPENSAFKMASHPPVESSRELDVIKERLRIYEAAVVAAKEKGEESKARGYQRAIDNINTMAKQVRKYGLTM